MEDKLNLYAVSGDLDAGLIFCMAYSPERAIELVMEDMGYEDDMLEILDATLVILPTTEEVIKVLI